MYRVCHDCICMHVLDWRLASQDSAASPGGGGRMARSDVLGATCSERCARSDVLGDGAVCPNPANAVGTGRASLCRVSVPNQIAESVCRVRLPSQYAESVTVCRARLPSQIAESVCRVRLGLPSQCAESVCRVRLPSQCAESYCRVSVSIQCAESSVPGRAVWHGGGPEASGRFVRSGAFPCRVGPGRTGPRRQAWPRRLRGQLRGRAPGARACRRPSPGRSAAAHRAADAVERGPSGRFTRRAAA